MIYTQICSYCKEEFPEKEMHISHDIPRYIGGTDTDGRHWLCIKHHKDYELKILKECLKIIGEDFVEGEEIELMKELSRQPESIKMKFRKAAQKIKEETFNDT